MLFLLGIPQKLPKLLLFLRYSSETAKTNEETVMFWPEYSRNPGYIPGIFLEFPGESSLVSAVSAVSAVVSAVSGAVSAVSCCFGTSLWGILIGFCCFLLFWQF